MSSKKTCIDALRTFGAERQIKKCVGKLNELSVALLHNEGGKTPWIMLRKKLRTWKSCCSK